MNITDEKYRLIQDTAYNCYCDGAGHDVIVDHTLSLLEVTVENKPTILLCNSEDHIGPAK